MLVINEKRFAKNLLLNSNTINVEFKKLIEAAETHQNEQKESGLNQLTRNLKERGWLLNHVSFVDAFQDSKPDPDFYVKKIIKDLFPKQAEHLLNHQFNFLNSLPLGSSVDIFSHGNDLYLEVITSIAPSSRDKQTRILFRVTMNNFEFLECSTNSMADYDLLMGVNATNQNWYDQRDRINWPWLAKNFKIFEPIFADSYITPLNQRLRHAYFNIMNEGNPYQLNWHSFIGWPGDESYHENEIADFCLKLGKYILTASFLVPIKNMAKLVLEYIPAIFEEFGAWLLDHSKKALENSHFLRGQVIAAVGIATGELIYGTSKIVRQVTMRATSPIRSAKEAFEYGKKAHFVVGCLAAITSIALSTTLMMGVTMLTAASLLPTPKNWGEALGYAVGIVLLGFAALIVTPIVLGIKAGLSKLCNFTTKTNLHNKTLEAEYRLARSLKNPSHQQAPATQSTTPKVSRMSGSFFNSINRTERKNSVNDLDVQNVPAASCSPVLA